MPDTFGWTLSADTFGWNAAGLVAVRMNDEWQREILRLGIITMEDGSGWPTFLRELQARGLKGVELVISDAPAL